MFRLEDKQDWTTAPLKYYILQRLHVSHRAAALSLLLLSRIHSCPCPLGPCPRSMRHICPCPSACTHPIGRCPRLKQMPKPILRFDSCRSILFAIRLFVSVSDISMTHHCLIINHGNTSRRVTHVLYILLFSDNMSTVDHYLQDVPHFNGPPKRDC